MKIKYSKPVLTGGYDSSYKKDIKFDLDIINGDDAMCDDGIIRMNIKIKLNSVELLKLLKENKASLGIKVKTSYLNNYYHNLSIDTINNIEVDTKELKRIDSIKCTAFITANENLSFSYNIEMDDVYKDFAFEFHKNEILAESTTDKLDYQASGSPFIQINTVENQEGIGFSIRTENVISVKVNEDLNVAFSKLQNESKEASPKGILNTFIAFNAIQYALIKVIVEGIDKYVNTDWFKALEYNFDDPSFEDLKDFIKAMSNNNMDQFDIDLINKNVQRMLNDQLSKKIIETWEAANGSRIKKN